jgi:hypothetical protein
MADELRDLTRRLAFATHCASEWAEPTDAVADIDDPPTPQCLGRRDIRLWGSETTDPFASHA